MRILRAYPQPGDFHEVENTKYRLIIRYCKILGTASLAYIIKKSQDDSQSMGSTTTKMDKNSNGKIKSTNLVIGLTSVAHRSRLHKSLQQETR